MAFRPGPTIEQGVRDDHDFMEQRAEHTFGGHRVGPELHDLRHHVVTSVIRAGLFTLAPDQTGSFSAMEWPHQSAEFSERIGRRPDLR